MSQSQTSGYDIIVQLSEQELNNDLETAFVIAPFTASGFTVQPTFDHIELDTTPQTAYITPNCVRLFINIDATSGNLSFSGQVEVAAPIDAVTVNGNRQIRIVFNNGNSNVPRVKVVPNSGNLPALVETPLQTYLRNTVDHYDIGPSVSPQTNGDPLKPTDVHVKVIDVPDPSGTDCLTLMLNTDGSTGGNPAGITQYVGTVPTGAIVVLSNQLLLEKIIRPALQSQLGATVNPPCVLASPVEIYTFSKSKKILGIKYSVTMHIFLKTMEVHVEGDHLRATGTFGGSGSGWSASGGFNVRLYIQLNNGAITIHQETDSMHADFDFKWWVWVLMGLGMGALGIIITAVAQSAINKVIDSQLSALSNFASQLGSLSVPAIPLPNGGQITVTNVLLDDLTFSGPIQRIPAAAAGLSICGSLMKVQTQTTIVLNGNTVSIMQLMIAAAGQPYTITRRYAYRGAFGAIVSQPVTPVTFAWSLGGTPLATGSPQSLMLSSGGGSIIVHYLADRAHCWVWTDAGTSIASLQLGLTMTDGAGHISQAVVHLACIGSNTQTGTTEGLQMASRISGQINILPVNDGGDGTIVPVVDRNAELRDAFARGASDKRAVLKGDKTSKTAVQVTERASKPAAAKKR